MAVSPAQDDPVASPAATGPTRRESFILCWALPALAITASLVTDLRFYGYPLVSPEVGFLLLLILIVSLLPAWGLWKFARLKPLIGALCFLVALDGHAHLGELWGLVAFAVASIAITWVLRAHLCQIGAFSLGALLIADLVVPPETTSGESSAFAIERHQPPTDQQAHLPPIVHIVFDEHAGLRRLETLEFEEADSVVGSIKRLVTDHDFVVLRDAYSRHDKTFLSLGSSFNFSSEPRPSVEQLLEIHTWDKFTLATNQWFDRLEGSGYRIEVLQSDYINFCEHSAVKACSTYEANTLSPISTANLSAPRKAIRILGHWVSNRLELVTVGSEIYTLKLAPRFSGLPRPSLNMDRVGPLAVAKSFDRIVARLPTLGHGQVLFAHLMDPHYPYVYTENCEIVKDLDGWIRNVDKSQYPRSNSIESRAERYGRYLDQTQCLHQQLRTVLASLPRDATVILQGDHGSRISLRPPVPNRENLSEEDLLDHFSTLFAIRGPNLSPGTVVGWKALDEIFSQLDPSVPAEAPILAQQTGYEAGSPAAVEDAEAISRMHGKAYLSNQEDSVLVDLIPRSQTPSVGAPSTSPLDREGQ